MILKSFEIENNIQKIQQYKFVLIYGENIGLKETLKKHYKFKFKSRNYKSLSRRREQKQKYNT